MMNENEATELFSVRGLKVIVTGAAGGNGYAIARGFASAGAEVFILDLQDEEIFQAKNQVKNSTYFQVDITKEHHIKTVMDEIGDIDVLVNNAGITLNADTDENYWSQTIDVNLTSAYRLINLVKDGMIKRGGGSIINITSISAHIGSSGNPSYHASKGGLRHMSKGFAADFGKYNIRVNCVCPGYIQTKMTQKSFNDKDRKQMIENRTMLGRWGDPQDLVGVSLFLASRASSYITGMDFFVDGGLTNKGF